MKRIFIGLVAVTFATSAFADNVNWSAEKQSQMNVNRNSDAGIGNGGERYNNRDGWRVTRDGEDGGWDRDPGNSADNNQACDTAC